MDYLYIQVVDGPGQNVTISLHATGGTPLAGYGPALGAIVLTGKQWEQFKTDGDDALAVATGRKPPRGPGDPKFFRSVPLGILEEQITAIRVAAEARQSDYGPLGGFAEEILEIVGDGRPT